MGEHTIHALRFLAARVATVHGRDHPEMDTLTAVIDTLIRTPDGDALARAALARRMITLTDGFTPWPEACGSVRRLFEGLQSLTATMPGGDPFAN